MVLALTPTASASTGDSALGTPAQVRDFQRAHHLTADGVAGPDTIWALATVPHGRGHMREASPAVAAPGSKATIEPPASTATGPRLAYLAMFVGGLAILAAVAIVTLREPVTYRLRVLSDSLKRPAGRPGAGVRMVPGHVFAEGRAARAGIGRFRGAVCAITELQGERCFLVRDHRRPRGVWVFESEIRELEEPHEIEPPLPAR
jgi:Putative peptidoglycan binding domain